MQRCARLRACPLFVRTAYMQGMTYPTTAFAEHLHPRSTKGTFTEKHTRPPEGGLGAVTYPVNRDFPIPQANQLETVGAAVLAVANDVSTSDAVAQALDVDPRQGAYYLSAAGYLGLVERERVGELTVWSPTALGQEFEALDEQERGALLADIASHTPLVSTYVNDGPDAALQQMSEDADTLADDTLERRLATVKAWAKSAESSEFTGALSSLSQASRARFADAVVYAARERDAASPRQLRYCDECFLELPITGHCTNCAQFL